METFLYHLWSKLDQQEHPHQDIVLRAFQIIEQDLLGEYNALSYKKQYKNSRISQEIKKHYKLTNKGRSKKIMGTTLIKSYTTFRS